MQHCSFSQINLQFEVISIYLFISCEVTIWYWLLTKEEGLFENDMKNKICRNNIDVHWRPRCRGVEFLFRPKFCWRIFERPKKVSEFSWLSTNYSVWKVSITFTDSCENEHSSWSGKTSYCSSQHCTGAQIWPFDHFAQLFQIVPWQHLPCQCHQHNPQYLVVSRI